MSERWHDIVLEAEMLEVPTSPKTLPLTPKQRQAILHRDNHHSQLRHYSESKGWYVDERCPYDNLPCGHNEVHHILPRGAGGNNSPENLITVAECVHTGRCPSGRISPEFSRR